MAAAEADDNDAAPQRPTRGRFFYHRLRRASFISPTTGERSKRVFTLREASNRMNGHATEETPLLNNENATDDKNPHTANPFTYFRERWLEFYSFADSNNGRGILKCSLAYLLGSLITFVPMLAALIGDQQDSKHMVATVIVWFHPARSLGSMHEATILGILGFVYAGFIGFTSMGLSMFFREQDLLNVGHAIVLIVFVGAGMGGIAWTKQHFGTPLVNVACSLASLGCITILIKEGSVQAGEFSTVRVVQVLLMICMGVIIATAVNVLVLPVTARRLLRNDFVTNTDLLGEVLISISRAFLSGREEDLQDEYFTKLQKEHQQSLQKMAKDLSEARNENYLIGKEKGYAVSTKIVECLDGLAQDLGGLRSAALAQFALVKAHREETEEAAEDTAKIPAPSETWNQEAPMPNILDVITEAPDESLESASDLSRTPTNADGTPMTIRERQVSIGSTNIVLDSPSDMFFTFMRQLGPPTKSLVYTLKQILDELPYKKRTNYSGGLSRLLTPEVEVAINENFHSSLQDAIDLYRTSRKEALSTLYASRALSAAFTPQGGRKTVAFSAQRQTTKDKITASRQPNAAQPPATPLEMPAEDVLADIEEVSACCGHFSFSLLDFAEDVMTYLSILDELREIMENPKFSWTWLMFWRRPWRSQGPKKFKPATDFEQGHEHGADHDIPEPIKRADAFADPSGDQHRRHWYVKIHRILEPLRRDDVKFAIKVGLGAVLYSLPAFIESSRPFFVKWRGEWGLVSYMAVCCMTIGAANTTGTNRLIGTTIGAALALVGWILAADKGDANPYLLAVFGWLVSTGCFYLILAKGQGPMGRFILLTYNLGALYAYSLSVHDDDHDDDEGGISPEIYGIVGHRLVAVLVGALWGIVITRFIWPISARRKLKDGLCLLWLRMSLVWKRDPLAMFLLGEPRSHYMDIREEAELQSFLNYLDTLQAAAKSEFELRGPFPEERVGKILERTRRMLDAFHAMNVIITKSMQCTPGEAAVLRYTRDERFALSARISHLFSVLASSLKLEYPLNDALPSIENSRDKVLARISEFRRLEGSKVNASEADYELIYAYVLVTGQLAQDIQAVSNDLERLFGTLNEEHLKLQ